MCLGLSRSPQHCRCRRRSTEFIPLLTVTHVRAAAQERPAGCYSGGICYTMAPQLNCVSIFCCAEAYWNRTSIRTRFWTINGRLVFGDDGTVIGRLLEEFEVVPDWGYYPPFPYSPQRLADSMTRLRPLLERVRADQTPRLPLAPTMAAYRQSLLFYTDLFQRLATVAMQVEEVTTLAKAAGKVPADRQELFSLDELQDLLESPENFPQKARLAELAASLRQADVAALTKRYWDTVYGIYDVIPHPVDPRALRRHRGFVRPLPLSLRDRASAFPFGTVARHTRQAVPRHRSRPADPRTGLAAQRLDAAGRRRR